MYVFSLFTSSSSHSSPDGPLQRMASLLPRLQPFEARTQGRLSFFSSRVPPLMCVLRAVLLRRRDGPKKTSKSLRPCSPRSWIRSMIFKRQKLVSSPIHCSFHFIWRRDFGFTVANCGEGLVLETFSAAKRGLGRRSSMRCGAHERALNMKLPSLEHTFTLYAQHVRDGRCLNGLCYTTLFGL